MEHPSVESYLHKPFVQLHVRQTSHVQKMLEKAKVKFTGVAGLKNILLVKYL